MGLEKNARPLRALKVQLRAELHASCVRWGGFACIAGALARSVACNWRVRRVLLEAVRALLRGVRELA